MIRTAQKNIFPDPAHNHDKCLGNAVQKARQVFSARNLRLTPLREQIYRQILTSHTALGAYGLLEHLNKADRQIAPITIYRILDLLKEAGLIHRIESQNAYYACYHDHRNAGCFVTLICRGCGTIAEFLDKKLEKTFELLDQNAEFEKERRVLEIEGLCSLCRQPKNKKSKKPGSARTSLHHPLDHD